MAQEMNTQLIIDIANHDLVLLGIICKYFPNKTSTLIVVNLNHGTKQVEMVSSKLISLSVLYGTNSMKVVKYAVAYNSIM